MTTPRAQLATPAESFLLELGDRLRSETDPTTILAITAEALGRRLAVSRVGFGEVEADGCWLNIERDWTDGAPSLRGRHNLPLGSAICDAYRRGETVVAEDLREFDGADPAERAALVRMEIAGSVAVPLVRDGVLMAFMAAQHTRPRVWSLDEVRLVEEVAARTWATLEHARTEVRLRESEEQFRTLAENMPAACWLGDASGRAIWVNQRGLDTFAMRGPEDGLIAFMVHPDDVERMSGLWAQAMAEGAPLDATIRMRVEDGGYRPFLSRAQPIRNDKGEVARWCGVVTDLSERHAVERRRAFLHDLAERTRLETGAEAILAITAEQLGRHLQVNRVSFSEIDPTDPDRLIVERDWTDGPPSVVGSYSLSSFGHALAASHHRGDTLVAEDTSRHTLIAPELAARFAPYGFVAVVDVPLVREGRLRAMLHVHQATPRRWTQDEVELVEETAERTWATLNRARAEAALAGRERDQRFLLAWSDAVRHETDPRSILAKTLAAIGEHLGVGRVNYAEADATGKALLVEQDWTDGLPSVQGATFQLEALGDAVVRDHLLGAVFRTDDVHLDPRFGPANLAVYEAVGAIAFVSIPLVKAGKLAAVLSIQQPSTRAWTEAEVRLMQEVAERNWATLERARTEERLRESEALLAAFMENAPVGMFIKDAEGRYLRLNAEMSEALGVAAEAALGRTPSEVIGLEIGSSVEALDREALAGQSQAGELSLPGRSRYATSLVIRFPVKVGDGPVTRTGGFTIDISDRKRAEAELQRSREALFQSEKLTALGSLLAGVSHELNNPLSIVVAQAVMMERQAVGSELAERAAKIRKAADRCARIVQTFLAMARQKRPERERVDLNAVVKAALDLTDYGLRNDGVVVVQDLAAGLPAVFADQDQLHQVLVNLLVNAQQALAGQAGSRRIEVRTAASSEGVLVEVADNGPGVPAEARRRVFEPFFTTKPQGQGTGVGLSFSLGLVEAHGGRLELLNGDEPGARFRITLPIGEAGSATAQAASTETSSAPALRRALVVDDEPEIADALADFLSLEGFQCETAISGREAQARLANSSYDLVVSDLRMPEVDGPALYAWIKVERPELAARTVFATGDTLGATAAAFLAREGRPVMEKPFTPASVRRLLDQLEAQ